VAQPIYEKLHTQTPAGYYLVADTAFPRGTSQIKGRIQAPIKVGQRITGNPDEVEEKLAFNRELLSYRQTAEWGMRALQGSFGRLRVPLEINHTEQRASLIETCVRLHNLRAQMVGINQIHNVYMKEWRATDDLDELWRCFENMLFSEQRRRDRISNYHMYASYDD
jgi:DDE superfamily endonuclease